MVGEIRDFETAEIGVKAALTDILSSVRFIPTTPRVPSHAWSIWALSLSPVIVALLVIGQRLARRICPECKN